MSETLEKIDSDYIFFALDDFFLYDFVQTKEINKCLEYLKSNSRIATFTFYPLFVQSVPSKYEHYNKKEKNSRYKVSALAGIWNKKILQKFLLGYKENIWEWERNATKRSNTLYPKYEFYVMKNNTKMIYPYDISRYGLFSGKWLIPTKEKFEELNIKMDFSKRGYYNEALRGLEKSIISSFQMESEVMPYYALTHKNSSCLACNEIFSEGKFKQEYNILGARSIIRWKPSIHWGFGVNNLKINIIYKNGDKEIINPKVLFGAFIKEGNMFIFNKSNPYMLIPTAENKIIAKLIVEGEIIFPLTKEILERTFNKETLTKNDKYLELSDKLWHEFLVSKEKMYHVDFNPQIHILSKSENEQVINGKWKIYKNLFINYFSVSNQNKSIDWMANKNPGYAIKNPIILLHSKNNKYRILSKKHIQKVTCKIRNTYYFLSSTILHFDIPYEDIDKVIIIGKFICPIKSTKLRKILYGK